MNEAPESVFVEVVYGTPSRQSVITVSLPAGSTVADAIAQCGMERQFPDMEIDPGRIGIYGRKVPMDQPLKPGDRVEIYRPLLADPKDVRRARAEAQKNSG